VTGTGDLVAGMASQGGDRRAAPGSVRRRLVRDGEEPLPLEPDVRKASSSRWMSSRAWLRSDSGRWPRKLPNELPIARGVLRHGHAASSACCRGHTSPPSAAQERGGEAMRCCRSLNAPGLDTRCTARVDHSSDSPFQAAPCPPWALSHRPLYCPLDRSIHTSLRRQTTGDRMKRAAPARCAMRHGEGVNPLSQTLLSCGRLRACFFMS
jgi:hypothetical protein